MENLEDKNQTGQEIEKIETIKINISNFTYDYKKTILKNIKIKFYKGERIGLIGKTGSGKSTIEKLLARLYNSNNIFINNKNIRNYKLKSIREKIYIVFQNQLLFPGTIEDNIKIGNSKVSKKRYARIIEENFIKDLIKQLPDGLSTQLSEYSNNLSGGQKQKINIARLLLHNQDLIILDEATSAMDIDTEKKVYNSINRFYKNNIILIISHRNSINNYCTRVMNLDNKNKRIIKLNN